MNVQLSDIHPSYHKPSAHFDLLIDEVNTKGQWQADECMKTTGCEFVQIYDELPKKKKFGEG
jgi:hypothetical protein